MTIGEGVLGLWDKYQATPEFGQMKIVTFNENKKYL